MNNLTDNTPGNQGKIVESTDRGPSKRRFGEGRAIDLSRAAFERLADLALEREHV
jgi:rare lipoprotein A (peptidoglycan hydrolase)